MEDRSKEYKAYIQLASETIDLLFRVKDEEFMKDYNLGELCANLCDFQDRWATPMELPFGMGMDLIKPIEVKRDANQLITLGCAIEHPEHKDKILIIGSSQWKQYQSDGTVEDSNIKITFAEWMITIFEVLQKVYSSISSEKSTCQSLASRWFYHATETDFEESSEGDADVADGAREKRAVVKAQSVINTILFGGDIGEEGEEEYDEEEDEDYEGEEEEEEEEEEENNDENLSESELKERAAQAADLKQQGNDFFLKSQMERALELYSQAIEVCPSIPPYDQEKAIYYGNRSATLVKLFQYEAVVKDCTKALKIKPDYLKVLVRRATAYEELEMLDEAYQDYQEILKLDPNHSEAQRCSRLLQAVLSDDGTGCINSEMIKKALTGMMEKAATRREQMVAQQRNVTSDDSGNEALLFKESDVQCAAREKISKLAENMNAFFPHPSHPIHFIRLLEKMKLEPDSPWFAWGNPPLEKIKSQLEIVSDDSEAKNLKETLSALSEASK